MDDESRKNTDSSAKVKNSKVKLRLIITCVVIIFALAVAGVYFWRGSQLQSLNKKHDEEVATLNKTVEALKKEITSNAAKAKSGSKDTTDSTAASKATISSAVRNKDFSTLGPLMTDPVRVIIAASEGIGDRTPAKAMEDLKYLNSATGTWNFDVPAATIADWKTGDYGSYIPEVGGVIGLSSDGYVVIFKLNSANKVSDIFMSVNAELM